MVLKQKREGSKAEQRKDIELEVTATVEFQREQDVGPTDAVSVNTIVKSTFSLKHLNRNSSSGHLIYFWSCCLVASFSRHGFIRFFIEKDRYIAQICKIFRLLESGWFYKTQALLQTPNPPPVPSLELQNVAPPSSPEKASSKTSIDFTTPSNPSEDHV